MEEALKALAEAERIFVQAGAALDLEQVRAAIAELTETAALEVA